MSTSPSDATDHQSAGGNGQRAGTPNRRLVQARALVVLASLLLVLATVVTWLRSDLLDSAGWTRTSARVLEGEEIRKALAAEISDRVLTVANVQDAAAKKLPPELERFAPVVSSAVASVVPQAVERVLAAPAVQSRLAKASRFAHDRAILLLDGGGRALSTSGGVVALNLEQILDLVGQRLGLGSNIGQNLPADKRQLVLFRSTQLDAAQRGVKALRHLSVIVPALAALLYLAALAIARGARRRILLDIGIGMVAAALVALVARRWIESYVIDGVVRMESARPAVRELLSIVTADWRERSIWLFVTGLLVIFAGWLAGPMRLAVRARALIAPPLERHQGWVMTGIVGFVLLLAALGPARTPGQTIPLLIELALAIVGVAALRRQVLEERSEAANPSSSRSD